jgi:D-glycero-D-manno-heptose 1,7-bisphosphate phosphatase
VSARFALVDRDGTISEEIGYVLHPAELRLIPGAAEGLRRLRELGLGIVVVTNQSPVGRGLITERRLQDIHDRMRDLLGDAGASVDAIEVCPHTPEDGCECRKPAPGMARRAAETFGFELDQAFVLGDHARDMELGRAVGATTILVLTGHGRQEREEARPFTDHVAADLLEASGIVASLLSEETPA